MAKSKKKTPVARINDATRDEGSDIIINTRKANRILEEDARKRMKVMDSFRNEAARIGVNTPNLLEATDYPLTRLSFNYQLINSLYRSSWIVRKIIDVVPSDMMKNWIQLKSELSPQSLECFEQVVRKTGTREKLLEGLRLGRLYGGAAALILLDGQDEYLDVPLDLRFVMPGEYKGLLVLDRWMGVYPSSELIDDINDVDFGLPKFYNINTGEGVIKVHHSRILRFQGRRLPYIETIAEQWWGESEIEIVYEELLKRDNTSFNIASLIFLANLRVIKMSDLGQLLSTGSEAMKKAVYDTLEAQNHLLSNMGVYVMDAADSMETHPYTFTGINDVYQSFMMDIAGAAEMPVTKLFGREPSGLNSSGESDLSHYEDSIEEKQRAYLTPVLDKLLPIIATSAWGAVPNDFDWKFNPVRRLKEEDRVQLAQAITQNVIQAFESGLISHKTALKELRQSSDITDAWSNITDEDIASASGEVESGSETGMEEMAAGTQQRRQEQDDDGIYEKPGWLTRFLNKTKSPVKTKSITEYYE